MKTIEELKKEQYDLKAKLHEIIELTNSEKFYKMPVEKRGLVNQQRVGMELYLGSLTKRIYEPDNTSDTSNLIWLSMLYGMLNTSSQFTPSSSAEYSKKQLKESDFEVKEESNEE